MQEGVTIEIKREDAGYYVLYCDGQFVDKSFLISKLVEKADRIIELRTKD